ncbi:hypothetical protein LPJ53_004250 [Coemansia erecta]|uniref:Thermolabile hemolysin n=1 Tax=Coemansia erecta TaxID=147472 RepID=A0A9W8CRV1_9FUNG|nr:hypothetical protein LPJ53_004250 [Coemansia erecta]
MLNILTTPLSIAVAALALAANAAPSPPAASSYGQNSVSPSNPPCGSGNNGTLIVFGDSYSDIGSRWKIVEHYSPDFNPPPWFEGRYSSGFMWNEWAGTLLDKTLANFAFGDGTSDNTFAPGPVPSIQEQAAMFCQQRNAKRFQHPEDNTVVIEIGTNDIFYGLRNDIFVGREEAIEFANGVADNIKRVVEKMIANGHKKFYISNIPPIYLAPRIVNLFNPDLTKAVVADFNQVYDQVFSEFAKNHSDIEISVVDTYSIVYSIITKLLPDLKIKHGPGSSCVTRDAELNAVSYCTNPDEFFFMDDLHPTRLVHKLVGYTITKILKDRSYVPTVEDMRKIIKENNLLDVAEPVAVNEYRADGSYDDINEQILNQPKRPQPPQPKIDNGKEIPYRLNSCSGPHY